jgi:hypothetical protein
MRRAEVVFLTGRRLMFGGRFPSHGPHLPVMGAVVPSSVRLL